MTSLAAFNKIVQRYREEDSPALQLEWGLLRMLDGEACKVLQEDLRQYAKPWEVFTATDGLADALPPMPGLYMFVWQPSFKFDVADRPGQGNLPQVLYIGQAGGANSRSNTIRQRYKDYRPHMRGNPEELWTRPEPVTRPERLSRYLSLRPLEFWCAIVDNRDKIEHLEKRLIRLFNPPLNDRGRPKIRARMGSARSAWAS
ncbi:hypothetical protein [Sphaerisporangium sp. NPDC051011]|uniref:hypothetical protein n=1 Tax=Sphaerisporangium sp. NPDC051011 TaxID=3155792 RepID=UPI0033EA418B